MLILVCVIGVVLGMMHRHRAHKPLTIMVISLGVLALVSFAGYAVEPIIYGLFGSAQRGGAIVSGLLMLWQGVTALVHAGSIAGLIVAVFTDRGIDVLKPSHSGPSAKGDSPSATCIG